ncbi:MAG TPA: hypothetical protein VEF55_07005, partial [Candidatus Binatia bacterium]|nr:hypothetical protein [Candidatus Binatia bacterium]
LKSVQRLYLISFIAASVVLAGGFPTNAEVNLFGMQVPAGVLSLQALSAIMVGIYSYFIAMLVSATMAYGILMCIFSQTYTESWDVFLAEYDATMLNANFLRPKHIGFASPKRERLAAWGVALTSFATLLLHWAVIVFAAYVALAAAMDAGSLVPTIIGGFALGAAVVGGLAYVTCTMVPMPYRMYDDDAQDAMTGEAELKPAAAAT